MHLTYLCEFPTDFYALGLCSQIFPIDMDRPISDEEKPEDIQPIVLMLSDRLRYPKDPRRSQLLKILDRSVKAGQDLDPFPHIPASNLPSPTNIAFSSLSQTWNWGDSKSEGSVQLIIFPHRNTSVFACSCQIFCVKPTSTPQNQCVCPCNVNRQTQVRVSLTRTLLSKEPVAIR